MPYPIERKLVVGISSSALFDLSREDEIYRSQGVRKYAEYQERNKRELLPKGVAFPFVRRFLRLNEVFPVERPVEAVLLSRNSPETGMRIFHSIGAYGLDITRAVFTSGGSPKNYIPAYNISLFLSTNDTDVEESIAEGHPAGLILKTSVVDDENDRELRVAFDFDGVLADDAGEQIYKGAGGLEGFHEHESKNASVPHNPGPLAGFFRKLAELQALELARIETDPAYRKIVRTAIVTARAAPAHERAINTLKSWDVSVDEMFFLGGIEKKRVLNVLKPHLFVDDQKVHLDESLENVPLVHIPFGIANAK